MQTHEQKPLISVVIINWNGLLFMDQCLNSVFVQSFQRFEAIVVDNYSTDRSLELIRKKYPLARIITNEVNLGFAKANNIGVREAKGEYILLINNDTILDKHCLENLYRFAKERKVGVLTAKMLFPDGETVDHAGGIFSRIGIALDRGLLSPEQQQFNVPQQVDYAHGSCVFMKRELYERVGGFDPDFFQYVEDVDLCLKVRTLGYPIFYCPSASLIHYDGGTTGRENRRRTKKMVTNMALTMIKNYSISSLVFFLPLMIVSRLFLGFAYIFKGRYDLFVATFEGLWGIPKALPSALRKRRALSIFRKTFNLKREFGILNAAREALLYFIRT